MDRSTGRLDYPSSCLPVHLSTCLPVELSNCPSVYMPTCLHVHMPTCLPLARYVYVYMSTSTSNESLSVFFQCSTSWAMLLSVKQGYLSTFPPDDLSVYLSICPPNYLSTCLPVHLSTCLFSALYVYIP